jgi:CRISPR-associated protein Csd1
MGKDRKFVGAPAPGDIAEAAYGRRVDEKLKKATVERLLPCIVDGRTIPCDLSPPAPSRPQIQRVRTTGSGNAASASPVPWCAAAEERRTIPCRLKKNRNSRDYLFGRLLAIAEKIESYALYLAKEGRDTTAERLMQRFSDHPASTWRTIELALRPYMQRLQSSRPGYLYNLKRLLDDVSAASRMTISPGQDASTLSSCSAITASGLPSARKILWTNLSQVEMSA